eukprot:5808089-Amphidinium_carterae.1
MRAGLSFGGKARPAWFACALAAKDLDPAFALHESMCKGYATLCAGGRVPGEVLWAAFGSAAQRLTLCVCVTPGRSCFPEPSSTGRSQAPPFCLTLGLTRAVR